MIEPPCTIYIGAIYGGDESYFLTDKLLAMFTHWAVRKELIWEILETVPAAPGNGLKSAKISIWCWNGEALSALHDGVHCLIRIPPESPNMSRHMSAAGVRVSPFDNLPLPEDMSDWGDERRRYICDPYGAVTDAVLGQIEIDPEIIFSGDFTFIERPALV